jgi:peptidoglycan/xylan/chitin deacetylase (PgdA/CDA1 family)
MKSTPMNRILNFHSVNDSDWFDRIICYLKIRYKLVSVETICELHQGHIDNNSCCHVTVDDGDKTFFDIMFPILNKYKVPASVYVSPKMCMEQSNYWFQEIQGYNKAELKKTIADVCNLPLTILQEYKTESIFKTMSIHQIYEVIERYQELTDTPVKTCQNMTVNDLVYVEKSGLVTVGAHTLNHPILYNEDDAKCKYEIKESVCELSTILKHEIKYFAYPNGIPNLDFTEREKSYLKEVGINLAFTTESRNMSSSDHPMCIPRYCISDRENYTYVRAKMKLNSYWDTLTRLKPTGEYRERIELKRIIASCNSA